MLEPDSSPLVFVVVPAYNESQTVGTVVARLLQHHAHVVVVDDGSADGTAEALSDSGAYVVRHAVNRGQGAALQTGIQFALRRGADVIVTFDADGQHDEADIEALVRPVLAGDCDLAIGSRFLGSTSSMPVSRFILLKLAVVFTRVLSGVKTTDVHNGLRAFSRKAATELRITLDRMAHASEIFDQIRAHRWRYREVPVTVRYTAYSLAKGQTSWEAIRIAFKVILEKFRQ